MGSSSAPPLSNKAPEEAKDLEVVEASGTDRDTAVTTVVAVPSQEEGKNTFSPNLS